jgi:FkbM family methyltransferase
MNEVDSESRKSRLPAKSAVSERSISECVTEHDGDNKDSFVSYSLNFEDVIFHRLFSDGQIGFYVDVGAGHPRLENDMFAFYQRGWSGINIEPNHRLHAALTEDRPRDANLRLGLSDRMGGALAYYGLNGSGPSVPVTTLSAVLAQADVAHINILKVEAGGFEHEVLNGNDWERFRPDVVVVAATYPEGPVRRPTNIRSFMEQRRYRHVYFDGLNDFYLECEFAAPEGVTLPPNVFDRFVPREIVDLQMRADCLAAENGRITDENAHLSFENRRLRRSAEQMCGELLILNQFLERLHEVSERLEQSDAALQQAQARLQSIYTSSSWLLTTPWRFVGGLIKRLIRRAADPLRPWLRA